MGEMAKKISNIDNEELLKERENEKAKLEAQEKKGDS